MTGSSGRAFRRLPILLLTLYWGALFVGTHLPRRSIQILGGNDKLQHFLGFAGLAFLLAWSLAANLPKTRRLLAALLIVALYGLFDELTQLLVPTRHGELLDWSADVAGGVLGVAAYAAIIALANSFRRGSWRGVPLASTGEST